MESLNLPFAVSRSKGAYALLLGSGVSRSAQILTGWDITKDLIVKLAKIGGENLDPSDAEAWYREQFGLNPGYSDILSRLATKPADRNAILRGYFVPTQEERDRNVKVPQEAHFAIAGLVAAGYIRVIVTTNFDSLVESALTQAGIDAQVISTADGIKGAIPLAHAACTVLKIHGDYQDTRILNTEFELSKYSAAMNRLIDRIFEDYGLIICGWSCEWDPALRAALERRRNQRYSTFWTHISSLKEPAQGLASHLKAETIQIAGADEFFRGLSESVKAIADTEQPHPLSAQVAEATVKRYVVDDRYRILLSELVMKEARRIHATTAWKSINSVPTTYSAEELQKRFDFYQAQTQTLMAMLVAGCYWGDEKQHSLWARAIRRLSQFAMAPGGRYDPIYYLQLFPAQLALYSSGIAAIGAERYDTLASLLLHNTLPDPQHKVSLPMAVHLIPGRGLDNDLIAKLSGGQRPWTPSSDYLRWKSGVREATKEVWVDDSNFDDLFDWFEFFLGLVNWDLEQKDGQTPWAYRGGFVWRDNPSQDARSMKPVQQLDAQLNSFGQSWGALRAGFFAGSLERVVEVGTAYVQALQASRMQS